MRDAAAVKVHVDVDVSAGDKLWTELLDAGVRSCRRMSPMRCPLLTPAASPVWPTEAAEGGHHACLSSALYEFEFEVGAQGAEADPF